MLEDVVMWLITRLLFFAVPITIALGCGLSVAWLIKRTSPPAHARVATECLT